MFNITIIILIVLQYSLLLFSTEEKKNERLTLVENMRIKFFNKSGKDWHSWIDNLNHYVQKGCAALTRFNESHSLKESSIQDQWEYIENLQYQTALIGDIFNYQNNQDIKERVFLKLLPQGFDVSLWSHSEGEGSFASCCDNLFKATSSSFILRKSVGLLNSLIYVYKPLLKCFVLNEKENGKGRKPWLAIIIDRVKALLEKKFEVDYIEKMLTPIMYTLTPDNQLTRCAYKDIHEQIRVMLLSLKVIQKTKNLKIPKPIIATLLFPQEIGFLQYCNQIEKEIGLQIDWIKENDPEYYKIRLKDHPCFENAQAFKEWYKGLKYSEKNK